ncbi:MAG: hypothetical protein JJ992_05435, partial [Planctomycetes bacterium]|nr:hypothetical protein [Planctomycetota bacterium]
MRLFTELKRRNVLRMAAFYLAAAWLVAQVAEVFVGLGKLPDSVGIWVIAVLSIGFPIALIVSWFFDITPEGVVRDADVPEGQPTFAAGGRRTDFVIIAMLAAAVILLLVWEPPASGDDALTVLPFESMTGPDEASFSEGVSIELLNLMAQLRKFKVKQPPSAAILAGSSDVPTLARQMNVRWVLKGSVRRAESRVRIAVQLIDANDDAAIVWSNVFDRALSATNLFAIQSEIARSITSELRQSLDQPAEDRLAAPPTQNTEAYNAYLLGRQRLTDRRVDWLEDAVNQFAHAVELDPNFAGAYSGLHDACALYYGYSGGRQHERCPSESAGLLQLAQKAVELDENLGEAWVSLGSALRREAAGGGWLDASRNPEIIARWQEANVAYERGLALNPNNLHGYLWYASSLASPAFYASWDSWLEAWKADTWQSIIKRGLEVDPLSVTLHHQLSDYPMWSRTKDEALYHANRVIEIAPDSPQGYVRLSELSWLLSGRIDESIRWASKATEIDPRQPNYPMQIALGYATLGDIDMAMAYWGRSGELIADEMEAQRLQILRALVLLSSKDGIPMQAVLDVLEPVRVSDLNRMEIEAVLAIIRGEATKWLTEHAEYLSECLDAPID